MNSIYEIPGQSVFGMRVVVCTNAEHVAGTPSGREVEDQDDATRAAESAADRACMDLLGGACDSDSHFPNWNGGKYYGQRPDLKYGNVVANLYQRDDLGDGDYDDWEWCGTAKLPADVLAEAKRVLDQIAEDHEAAIV